MSVEEQESEGIREGTEKLEGIRRKILKSGHQERKSEVRVLEKEKTV